MLTKTSLNPTVGICLDTCADASDEENHTSLLRCRLDEIERKLKLMAFFFFKDFAKSLLNHTHEAKSLPFFFRVLIEKDMTNIFNYDF